ncbi:MAG: protease inhibitor I42 family protein [Kiritimatiellae bacterium]|nr:protease inhibitor I42 family protein [Kiritimatiellia bacterium]
MNSRFLACISVAIAATAVSPAIPWASAQDPAGTPPLDPAEGVLYDPRADYDQGAFDAEEEIENGAMTIWIVTATNVPPTLDADTGLPIKAIVVAPEEPWHRQCMEERARGHNDAILRHMGRPASGDTARPDAPITTPAVCLTEEQNGNRVELAVGGTLEIALPGNPTTGYSWDCTADETPVLLLAEPDYRPDSRAIGAGGRFIFRFRATAAGESTLRLVYRRPWEKDTPPLKTYEVTIAVRP